MGEGDAEVARLELVRRDEPGGEAHEVDAPLDEQVLVVRDALVDHAPDAGHDGGEVDLRVADTDAELLRAVA